MTTPSFSQSAPWPSPAGTARAAIAGDGDREIEARLGALDLGPEILYAAWELAAWPVIPDTDRPAVRHLALALLAAGREGHTRLALGGEAQDDAATGATLDETLRALGLDDQARARTAARLARVRADGGDPLRAIIGAPGARTPLVLEGDALYTDRVHALESAAAAALAARLASSPETTFPGRDVARTIAAVAAAAGLTDEQTRAVTTTLTRRLGVVTGGPGTGKTSVVVAILRALVRLGVAATDIVVAAPTGKAANRLAQSLQAGLAAAAASGDPAERALADAPPTPSTLHRLLGFQPATGRFSHHGRRPLPARFVIVDEASMIDLSLMERLLAAAGGDTSLLLLGDADQLPSVEAGAVFRDLLPWAVRLTKSFRMSPTRPEGRALLEAARAVNEGDAGALLDGATPLLHARAAPEDVAFTGVELLEATPAARAAFLDRWSAEITGRPFAEDATLVSAPVRVADGLVVPADRARAAALLAHFDRARIFCVTRGAGRATGAAAINAELHARHAGGRGPAAIAAGEPLMMLRNDYARGLWNGDQGVCLWASSGGSPRLAAVFPRGDELCSFPLETMRGDVELGYALTVHKAQGSELEIAALILPDADVPLLSRQILYTGLTRCKRGAVIVGARDVLRAGVARTVTRGSGLAARLSGPP